MTAVVAAFFSGAACSQLTNSNTFLQDYPSITHRYGNDNPYSRWRATGQWDALHTTGPREYQNAVPPSSDKNDAGRAVKQDGYGEPIKR